MSAIGAALWLLAGSNINALETDFVTEQHVHAPTINAWTADDVQ